MKMSKRSREQAANAAAGNPRTGDGRKGGVKPEARDCRMMSAYDSGETAIRRQQPRGWGIARVIDIVTRKERDK
jgi:hypothetical protein